MSGAGVKLSESQLRAVRADSAKVVVSAAAGSGKTTVIVEKFTETVRRGVPLERVVCITYTHKAAQNLRSRLAERFEEAGMTAELERLEDGFVSTIDGFCLRLLKEFAIDAGIDPAFKVLDEDVALLLQAEAADAVFERHSTDPDMAPLFEAFSPAALEASLKRIYGRWRSSPGSPRAGAEPPDPDSLAAEAADAWRSLGKKGAPPLPDGRAPGPRVFAELEMAWDAGGKAHKNRDQVYAYRKAIDRICEAHAERLYGSAFLRLLDLFHGEYSRRKRERACLDFSDLVRGTAEALAADTVLRDRVAASFDLVLVDEYQDVNPLQARLFSLLAGKAQFFYVGDVRQSIYRFRHADCREFLKASKESDVIELAENRRSRPHILEFVNELFGGECVTGDFPYGRVTAVKDERAAPEIRVLAVDRGREDLKKAAAARRAEAAAIAAEIAELSRADVSPGDCAILLRSRGSLHVYEAALREAGIRYHVMKGKGFYYKPEIADVICALRALMDPGSDLWVASLLKSPLCGVSDDALFLMREKWPDGSFFDAARRAADDLSGCFSKDAPALAHFFDWFTELAERRKRLAPDRVIAELLAATQYDAAILAADDGARRRANLGKLQEKAASYARTESGDLARFVRFIEALSMEEMEESEASVDSEGDAVKILTVHASKGLEFPIVFITDKDKDGGRREGEDAGFLATDSLEIISPVPDWVSSGRFCDEKEEEKARETEESGRAFYVALTRAMDRVYLCGSSRAKQAKDPRSWMDRVEAKIPFLRDEDKSGVWNGIPIRVIAPAPAPVRRAGTALAGAADLERLAALLEPAAGGAAKAIDPAAREALARLAFVDKGYFETLDLRVTDFVEHLSPYRPAPIAANAESGAPVPAAAGMPAAEFGSLYHRMLQYADFSNAADREIRRLIEAIGPHLDEASARRMAAGLKKFFDSKTGAALRRAAAAKVPVYRELSFLFRVAQGERDLGFLSGQADLLYRGADGWTLVDYKTGRRAESHREQLLIYAHCLGRLLRAPIRSAELYYAEEGESAAVDLSALEGDWFAKRFLPAYAELRERTLAGGGAAGAG